MYRIKEKMLDHVMKYCIKTGIEDLKGIYSLDDWNKNGFKKSILEKVD